MNNSNNKDNKSPRSLHQSKEKPVTIYVGNLVYTKNEFELKAMFRKYGKVISVEILEDKKTKKKKGIAFVKMAKKSEALRAVKELDGIELDGRTLKTSIAQQREEFKRPFTARSKDGNKKENNDEVAAPVRMSKKERLKNSGLNKLFNFLKEKK